MYWAVDENIMMRGLQELPYPHLISSRSNDSIFTNSVFVATLQDITTVNNENHCTLGRDHSESSSPWSINSWWCVLPWGHVPKAYWMPGGRFCREREEVLKKGHLVGTNSCLPRRLWLCQRSNCSAAPGANTQWNTQRQIVSDCDTCTCSSVPSLLHLPHRATESFPRGHVWGQQHSIHSSCSLYHQPCQPTTSC